MSNHESVLEDKVPFALAIPSVSTKIRVTPEGLLKKESEYREFQKKYGFSEMTHSNYPTRYDTSTETTVRSGNDIFKTTDSKDDFKTDDSDKELF